MTAAVAASGFGITDYKLPNRVASDYIPADAHYSCYKNDEEKPFYGNIMYDKRVIRGSTWHLRKMAQESLKTGNATTIMPKEDSTSTLPKQVKRQKNKEKPNTKSIGRNLLRGSIEIPPSAPNSQKYALSFPRLLNSQPANTSNSIDKVAPVPRTSPRRLSDALSSARQNKAARAQRRLSGYLSERGSQSSAKQRFEYKTEEIQHRGPQTSTRATATQQSQTDDARQSTVSSESSAEMRQAGAALSRTALSTASGELSREEHVEQLRVVEQDVQQLKEMLRMATEERNRLLQASSSIEDDKGKLELRVVAWEIVKKAVERSAKRIQRGALKGRRQSEPVAKPERVDNVLVQSKLDALDEPLDEEEELALIKKAIRDEFYPILVKEIAKQLQYNEMAKDLLDYNMCSLLENREPARDRLLNVLQKDKEERQGLVYSREDSLIFK